MKKSVMRRVGDAVGYLFIALIAVGLLFVFFSNLRGNTVFIAGKTVMWVKTESMEPQIPARSYILVEKSDGTDVSVGDVIVFRSDDPVLNGAYNTHRVVEVIGDHQEFVTRGDNNPVNDEYTAKAKNVAGIYRKNLPVLSAFGRFLSTKIGILISVTVIFAIMLILYLPDMIKLTKARAAEVEAKKKEQMDALIQAEIERLKAAESAKTPEETAKDPPENAAAEEEAETEDPAAPREETADRPAEETPEETETEIKPGSEDTPE